MTTATFSHQPYRPGVVRLRVGRLVACIILVMALVVGGGLWFLHAYGRKVTTKPVDTTMSPTWMKQGITYPPDAQAAEKAAAQNPDRSAEILRQLAALQQQLSADLPCRFWGKVNNFRGLFEPVLLYVATIKSAYIEILS